MRIHLNSENLLHLKLIKKVFMGLKEGDEVDLIIGEETNLGYNALINDEFDGLLYHNEIFVNLEWDMKIIGYIKKIRSDGKIDVSLQPQGFSNAFALSSNSKKIEKNWNS